MISYLSREEFLAESVISRPRPEEHCAICQADPQVDPVSFADSCACNSSYCRDCINTWLTDECTCPTCRKRLYGPPRTLAELHEEGGFSQEDFGIDLTDLPLVAYTEVWRRMSTVSDIGWNQMLSPRLEGWAVVVCELLAAQIVEHGNTVISLAIVCEHQYSEAEKADLSTLLQHLWEILKRHDGDEMEVTALKYMVYAEMLMATSCPESQRLNTMIVNASAGNTDGNVTVGIQSVLQIVISTCWALDQVGFPRRRNVARGQISSGQST